MASPYFRPVIVLTAILTLAQSITWFILSLLGILSYRCEFPPSDDSGTKFTNLLYFLYFQGPQCPGTQPEGLPAGVHLRDYSDATPSYINGWMSAYLAFSILYFFVAIKLFVSLCRSKNEAFPTGSLRLWTINTLAFLIMDFWLTIVWGLEFQNLNNFVDKFETQLNGSFDWLSSVPGALMAITARGFILYVVNFALFCYLVRYAYDWSILASCCHQIQNGSSQQQLHYPDNDARSGPYHSHHGIPRLNPDPYDNHSLSLHHSRRGPITHPNAVEGVTAFNAWDDSQRHWESDHRGESKSLGRSRPASPQRRQRDEEVFRGYGRPSVRSAFEYPDRRNFEQGGKSASKYPPTKSYGKNNEAFY